MATVVGQCAEFPLRATKKERSVLTMRIIIGASGAVSTSSDMSDPGLTAVKNTTGVYDCTMPAMPGLCQMTLNLYSPSLTVVGAVVTAKSLTAGTFTVKTLAGSNAAAATEPASGDEIWITLHCDKRAGN